MNSSPLHMAQLQRNATLIYVAQDLPVRHDARRPVRRRRRRRVS